jgi:L-lysine 2,3-aminomutase
MSAALASRKAYVCAVCPVCKEEGVHCMRIHSAETGNHADGIEHDWSAACRYVEGVGRIFEHKCVDHGGEALQARFGTLENLLAFLEE